MERAIDDYVNEYSISKCHACQNGGTVLLLDGKCICSCPITAEGIACEVSKQITPPGKNKLLDIMRNTNTYLGLFNLKILTLAYLKCQPDAL